LGCNKKHKLLPSELSFEPYWAIVQFFQTGLLGDCEDHLLEILSTNPKNEIERWIKSIVMPDYFLAGYQTPYHVVEQNLYKLFIDVADLYSSIKRGNTDTKLSDLSEMHLLWFFQRIIRKSYEFEYFRRAISATILNIEQEVIPDETKFTALFFAACYAAELNDPSGFEFLIKEYGADKLPLPISLAIQIEHNTNKDFTKIPLLKDHEKKLGHILKLDHDNMNIKLRSQDKSLNDLFDKPIKLRPKDRP
jgi:hypothetical protein